MNAPLLTMVIPVRNRPRLIIRLLECISQELSECAFETVIVDNNSTDLTPDTIMEWLAGNPDRASHIRFLRETTPGACAARNLGLHATTTPYIMFFDSDDYFEPGHIATIVRFLASAASTGHTPDVVRWPVKAAGNKARYSGTPHHITLLSHLFHSTLATMRFCAKTELVKNVGGWDESLMVWNDLEFGFRLLLTNPSTKLLDNKPTVIIEPQEQSITGLRWSDNWTGRLKALDAIEADADVAARPDIQFAIDCRRMLLAAIIANEGCSDGAETIVKGVRHTTPWWRYAQLRLVYAVQRLFKRGGTFVATLFS